MLAAQPFLCDLPVDGWEAVCVRTTPYREVGPERKIQVSHRHPKRPGYRVVVVELAPAQLVQRLSAHHLVRVGRDEEVVRTKSSSARAAKLWLGDGGPGSCSGHPC